MLVSKCKSQWPETPSPKGKDLVVCVRIRNVLGAAVGQLVQQTQQRKGLPGRCLGGR